MIRESTRLRILAARKQYFELGWPVTLDTRTDRLALVAGAFLDGVTMPAALGQRVLARLRITASPGPVLAGPQERWWTFLTRCHSIRKSAVPEDVGALRVLAVPRDAPLVVPATLARQPAGDVPWRWISPPRSSDDLPEWTTVITAIRLAGTRVRSAP